VARTVHAFSSGWLPTFKRFKCSRLEIVRAPNRGYECCGFNRQFPTAADVLPNSAIFNIRARDCGFGHQLIALNDKIS
jgi:hypothetical protein